MRKSTRGYYPPDRIPFAWHKPASVFLALVEGTFFHIGETKLYIEPGWAVVFDGDIIHGEDARSVDNAETNVRYHCYLDVTEVWRPPSFVFSHR